MHDYILQRADIDGKNIITLSDSCIYFSLRDDYLYYTKLAIKDNYYYGAGIYKVAINETKSEQIYTGDTELCGSSGNWIYFTKPNFGDILRVRLDGTREMQLIR